MVHGFPPEEVPSPERSWEKKETNYTYHLHGEQPESTKEIKYLGITITENLKWKQHIANVSNKANQILGFVRRNLKTTNKRLKDLAYKAFIRPLLEYSSSVWDPNFSDDIKNLEKIQNRAARWATSRFRRTSHVSEILDSLDWPSLQQRRKKARLETFYTFHNGLVAIESSHLPKLKPQVDNKANTRSTHSSEYEEPSHPRTYRQKAFFPRTIAEWNRLPQEVVSAETLALFKSRVSSFICPPCN